MIAIVIPTITIVFSAELLQDEQWFIVGMKKVMGTNHKAISPKSVTIFLYDDGAVLFR